MPFRFNNCQGEGKNRDCPSCYSSRIYRDGIRETEKGSVQRYICRDCGYRFSETSVLSTRRNNIVGCQVCAVLTEEAKNLATVEPPKGGLAEATELTNLDPQKLIFQYAWYLKKMGRAESTITSRVKLLKILVKRNAELLNPDSIKDAIARQEWCNKRKMNAVDAYSSFLQMIDKTWNPPRYKFATKLPFIPKEAEIDALIAGCGPKTSAFLQLLKETGVRSGEAAQLLWTDIDFENGTIRVTPEKGSDPRIFKASKNLLGSLSILNIKSKRKRVFSAERTIRKVFEKQRKRNTIKLQNPRLQLIHCHTFRHWKGTMLYHQTKDPLYVMRFLGHKNIRNTLMYIQLEEAIFQDEDKGFICKVSETVEESKQLIESGFDYVCDQGDIKLFRKKA